MREGPIAFPSGMEAASTTGAIIVGRPGFVPSKPSQYDKIADGVWGYREEATSAWGLEHTIRGEKELPSGVPWAKGDNYIEYHDTEWGVPVHDDRLLFEFLVLEGAQAGLSWSTILNKRDNYRQAFDSFAPAIVAKYGEKKRQSLLSNPGIVRNRLEDRRRHTECQGVSGNGAGVRHALTGTSGTSSDTGQNRTPGRRSRNCPPEPRSQMP